MSQALRSNGYNVRFVPAANKCANQPVNSNGMCLSSIWTDSTDTYTLSKLNVSTSADDDPKLVTSIHSHSWSKGVDLLASAEDCSALGVQAKAEPFQPPSLDFGAGAARQVSNLQAEILFRDS